ncbi:mitochondrial distribution and morphology protein family 31/32 [Lanmaoa asiatica]|nr:mitochondrial distribution and morphology protein family 31/32 [Lanmaoa asiatica]
MMLRSALLRHTTRGILHPTVDRYSAIRLFFIRQLVSVPHSPQSRLTTFAHRSNYKPPGVDQKPTEPHSHLPPLNLDNYPRLYRRLALSLSHLHRPSRDDFLKVANGFWQRLRIRFKWFTIRSFRKFNADDISAFITWFLMSQTLWILVGTTTFFSVVFATANSLRLQEYVAKAISNYLTSETGVTVIFESAIVPKWKDSRISFKNVYVSRRPQVTRSDQKKKDPLGHQAAVAYDMSNHPAYNYTVEEDEEVTQSHADDDLNYSMFDLNIDSIDVTLSLKRWLDGKGLVEDAVVKGVRGVLDRRSVFWDPENPLDPAAFRSVARSGDFELHSLQLEDVLVTVYQPGNFRPYTASIFRADIRTLRKQWLFYDFLRAENVVGQFDNCLFSLHKPQSIGRTTEQDIQDGKWSRMTRIRIDGVNIDHMQNSTTDPTGPLSWITSGKVDAVLDIKFPRETEDEYPFNALLGELADAISTAASASLNLDRIPGQRELAKPPLVAPSTDADENEPDKPRVVIDIDLRLRDLKAGVPLFTENLSYVNNALIRPIVAFMNVHHTLVPIHCRVVKGVNDFDGAWTVSGLMDEISQKVYDALAYHVSQANMNRRVKVVGVWSLQMTASAILSALRNIVDPMTSRLREVYYVDGIPYDALLLFGP